MTASINVKSEIGKLTTVILKRPGKEIENITPATMPRLLFDDIPYLPIAQKEHDQFAEILKQNGTEVLYLDDLAAEAIQDIAGSLFENASGYDTVIAIKIPNNHAMMHLDTVFTMVNYDQFTVHPAILTKQGQIDSWILHPAKDGISIEHHRDLKQVLKTVLDLDDLDLIPTGNGDPIAAPREQWNDGSNTLAIAPGEVVTYNRNYVSNEILRKHGLKVHEILSSELSRGRGGPRCMSMPLIREDLKK